MKKKKYKARDQPPQSTIACIQAVGTTVLFAFFFPIVGGCTYIIVKVSEHRERADYLYP